MARKGSGRISAILAALKKRYPCSLIPNGGTAALAKEFGTIP